MSKARATKVDELDCRMFAIAEQNVFGFQVAVNDVLRLQKVQRVQNLNANLADQWERETLELGALQHVVQVEIQQLKHNTEVILPVKVCMHAHYQKKRRMRKGGDKNIIIIINEKYQYCSPHCDRVD